MDQLSDPKPLPLQLTRAQWNLMREDAETRYPEEACGLVIGKSGLVSSVVPVTNILHSRVRYRMDPGEQLKVLLTIEENGWDLTAIYHSHPDGPAAPSSTDIDECFYPDVVQLIWFKKHGDWHCKGFNIHAGLATEVPVNLIGSQ